MMPSAKLGPDQKHGLEAPWRNGFSRFPARPDHITSFVALPKLVRRRSARSLRGHQLGPPISLAAGHDRPDHSGGLVGERDGRDLRGMLGHQLHEPGSVCPVPLRVADNRQGADDQQLAQVAVALFGDPAQPSFAAAGVLLRHEPDPSSQVAPGIEGCGSGTLATIAPASIGPTLGTAISRRPTSVARALARISRSVSSAWRSPNRAGRPKASGRSARSPARARRLRRERSR
jgi:hypothetical protein